MSGFSAEWLALREPYDLSARNKAVLDAVVDLIAGQISVAIVDLACGIGSTFRALSPRIKARQDWRLVDNDLSLLARVPRPSPGINVTAVPVDLNRDLEAAFNGPANLVTTSALLDLVSGDWLNRLAVEAAARRLPVYAALSYDGRAELAPFDPFDQRIVDAVNRHQRTDKGFGGPALGPSAAETAIAAFERVGYQVTHGVADWQFGPPDREIQTEILSGWAAAARQIGDPPRSQVMDWFKRRRELIASGLSSLRVGHIDLLARATGTR